MSAEVWGYVISGAVSMVICLVNNYFTRKQTEALILYRIDQLEKSVSKHNDLIERMYKVEKNVALHDERISNLEKVA